ncbi:hypothetical protein CYY_005056 [Polysphondylium violaceum]|uniref:Late endosomal/lysosomal adaptor and MAPK and MTOR activator 5 n=1 Tax=Polysphondylium violaceum TaxID=133409 RepID=A0A8J4V4K6_9MYCE|nr:hypothetical protein CYY_005056 [Polysphondylium violaceum]
MDNQLLDTFSQISSQSGVLGFVCADENGLCLKAQGTCQSSTSGSYKSLMDKAKILADREESPLIVIETDTSNIFIQNNQNITLAVSKLP